MRAWWLIAIGCSKPQQTAPAPVDTGVEVQVAAKPDAPSNVTLDDRCKKHDDCAAIDLFIEGDLKCCLACGARAAANKASADAFLAMCAHDRETRECPVYDCKAELLDAKCVGGHCQLAPRAK